VGEIGGSGRGGETEVGFMSLNLGKVIMHYALNCALCINVR
jgi:hypothetical protein